MILQDNGSPKLQVQPQQQAREIRNNSQLAIHHYNNSPAPGGAHGALLGNSSASKQVMMSLTKRHGNNAAGSGISNKWLPSVSTHDTKKSRPGNGSKR